MNVLLDTHVLIWWIRNSALLGKRAKALIRSAETSVWISAVSVWEISIRAALGRLDVSDSFQRELIVEMERSQFRPLPITFEHAFAVRHLPLHHGDPFDRLLIVQAQCGTIDYPHRRSRDTGLRRAHARRLAVTT